MKKKLVQFLACKLGDHEERCWENFQTHNAWLVFASQPGSLQHTHWKVDSSDESVSA